MPSNGPTMMGLNGRPNSWWRIVWAYGWTRWAWTWTDHSLGLHAPGAHKIVGRQILGWRSVNEQNSWKRFDQDKIKSPCLSPPPSLSLSSSLTISIELILRCDLGQDPRFDVRIFNFLGSMSSSFFPIELLLILCYWCGWEMSLLRHRWSPIHAFFSPI